MILQIDLVLHSNDLPQTTITNLTNEIYEYLLESKQALKVAEQLKKEMETKMSIDDILYEIAQYNAERQTFSIQKTVVIDYRRN